MNASLQPNVVSPEEFHEFEELSEVKHEFWNGTIVAMAGGTDNHSIICGNIAGAARELLKGKPCRARNSENRVRIESANAEYYPDALLFCPPGRFAGKGDRVLLNPQVIFEVLSDSTEKIDRGSKFRVYRACASITDYVLVSQDRVLVEHFRRVEEGWLLRSFNSLEDSLQFPDLEVALPLSEIYDELDLSSALLLMDEMNQTFGEN
jgi:Uma2 family endonuclease